MRRLAIGVLATLAAALGLFVLPARAASEAPTAPPIEVFQVSGLLDPIVADAIDRAIDHAVSDGAQVLVLQWNSKGSVVSSTRLRRLLDSIANAPIPVGIWVGPSGARAYGPGAQLLGVAAATGMAPGSRLGKLGEALDDRVTSGFGEGYAKIAGDVVGARTARDLGLLALGPQALDSPTLGDFVVGLDGLEYGTTRLKIAETVQTGDGPRQQTVAPTRSSKLPAMAQLLHTVASPPVTFLLFTIALLLLVFEFFTAGVGIAGLTGALCLLLGCYGVGVLPERPWALALVLASGLAFAVDVQTGVPRVWTGIGVTAYVVGAVWLWDGVSMSWIPLVVGVIGTLLTVLTGMPSMVRTRFATPTIGRDWMIGELGDAVTDISPDGVVSVSGAQWKAHANRATPIASGDQVRVVAIVGTELEVEPLQGGARDYREGRAKLTETPL